MLKIISLGLGVQSTTLYLMSCLNQVEKADYAIFADPGAEKPETYQHLRSLQSYSTNASGIPIIHSKRKNLFLDLTGAGVRKSGRFASIPAYANKGKSQLRRQCTREYKTEVIDKEIRALYGLKPRQRYPETEVWIGFTVDEAMRMSDSREKWRIKKYPLIDLGMSRNDCEKWLKDYGFAVPPKSSCVFCPYQNDERWKEIKATESFDIVKLVDSEIRNSTKKGIKEPIFLHDSCKPIDEVIFTLDRQVDLFNNICDGDCGI